MLFGGLITIPYWGYRNLSLAMTEIMLSDLPHIKYNNKETYTQEYQQMLTDLSRDRQNKIKKHGLAGIGLNLDLSNVQDGNALLQDFAKH